ncbi:Mannose-6-phosphate isomerase, cupin superfamily [Bryocella elongata]|uniref:Mannose-6-phosphate isomerase, cupin superfamily n=1 Tax=Bryocella elongata TaxID=863522 RepID=A0A1H6BNK5_9BACT|nr:cupin domain-containing protein [Bryocella elongata]SEG62250.1 Mannose-6-phosphate isomerase, cupin superfamily [Bryocella elongata]
MLTQVISATTAEHYRWGGPNADQADGWFLVKQPGLHVIEELLPPGVTEARHLHKIARQLFYVLAGELTMEVDGDTFTVPAGKGIEIAPGLAHQAANHGPADLRILVISQPPSHGDRFPA